MCRGVLNPMACSCDIQSSEHVHSEWVTCTTESWNMSAVAKLCIRQPFRCWSIWSVHHDRLYQAYIPVLSTVWYLLLHIVLITTLFSDRDLKLFCFSPSLHRPAANAYEVTTIYGTVQIWLLFYYYLFYLLFIISLLLRPLAQSCRLRNY